MCAYIYIYKYSYAYFTIYKYNLLSWYNVI